ncbi:MAG: hypothetical protein U0J65_03125 [Christensenellales bacterium]|nr:hypothetical protein [Christensenellales bacterium]
MSSMKKKEPKPPKRPKAERRPYYTNKATLTVYLVLRVLVILVMVRSALKGYYESVFLCGLTLFLMILPSVLTRRLRIELPSTLEIIILLFIFAAEILGEINSFYIRVPNWDTMLHTLNGFLCAAIGFALVDLLNRSDKFSFKLSPVYLAVVAFCFSMTVGVLWEFLEYAGDTFFGLDMQKDTIIHTIRTVEMDPTRSNKVIVFKNITDTILVHADGTQTPLGLGGYLDVGLNDTMKDLLVNFVGAIVFSIIGFFYVKEKGKGRFAARFIPRVKRKTEKDE